MSASFKEPIQFDSLVATFRSSPFVIHEVPIVTFPWWRGIKTDVGLHGNGTSSAVLGSGTGGLAGTSPIVIQRATKLGVLAFQIIILAAAWENGEPDQETKEAMIAKLTEEHPEAAEMIRQIVEGFR